MEALPVKPSPKPPFRKVFVRSQVVSLAATSVDFAVAMTLHLLFNLYYVSATTLGSLCGAVTSFFLGRNWVFVGKKGKIRKQAFRFLIMNAFSIFINSTAVFFFKENFRLSFLSSRILVAILVGMFFNFLINRYFVFK